MSYYFLGYKLFLAVLAHLLIIGKCYLIIEEEDDLNTRENNENDIDNSMVPYVYRPRYSASITPDKRTIDKGALAEDYKELREESNIVRSLMRNEAADSERKRTRYVIVREASTIDDDTTNNHRESTKTRQPQTHYHHRPRFHMIGKKQVHRQRFHDNKYDMNGKPNGKRRMKVIVLKKHNM